MRGANQTEQLRKQALRIREAVLARHGYAPDAQTPASAGAARLDDVARLARVSAHWGIASNTPLVGPLLVYWRRMLRILLRWYINPIVEQQNAFNQAVSRAMFDLQSENEELRVELAELRATREHPAREHTDPA
jgi:hypothetical protein